MQRTLQLRPHAVLAMPETTVARLKQVGVRREFADGEFIMRVGDKAEGFWLIVDGQVMCGRYSEEGLLTVMAIIGAGDIFGDAAFFVGAPRVIDAVADGPVSVIWIDSKRLRQLFVEDVDLAFLMLHSVSVQLHAAIDRIQSERRFPADIRLARALLNMLGEGDGKIVNTQQQLADLLSVSRVTLSTALRKLRKAELVEVRYGSVTVRDEAALSDWVANACGKLSSREPVHDTAR